MRTINLLSLLAFAIGLVGCSGADTPPGVTAHTRLTKTGLGAKLGLIWPGQPLEGEQTIGGEGLVVKHYTATFTDKRRNGMILYSAFVQEFPAEAIVGHSPRELLLAQAAASASEETSRREYEHGPRKWPGLDITTCAGQRCGRRILVVALPRTYEVSVTATNERMFREPQVEAFFNSLAIDE